MMLTVFHRSSGTQKHMATGPQDHRATGGAGGAAPLPHSHPPWGWGKGGAELEHIYAWYYGVYAA